MPKNPEVSHELWEGGDSPQVTLMQDQMRFQYKLDQFDNPRVDRLCQAAGVTLAGLCAMAGVFGVTTIKALRKQADRRAATFKARKVKRYTTPLGKRGRPVEMWIWPWPIALHFAKIEKFLYELKFEKPSPPGPDEEVIARKAAHG